LECTATFLPTEKTGFVLPDPPPPPPPLSLDNFTKKNGNSSVLYCALLGIGVQDDDIVGSVVDKFCLVETKPGLAANLTRVPFTL
jgi:hypothetical protein